MDNESRSSSSQRSNMFGEKQNATSSTYGSAKSVDKYANAKAISSADLFGDEPNASGQTPQSKVILFYHVTRSSAPANCHLLYKIIILCNILNCTKS